MTTTRYGAKRPGVPVCIYRIVKDPLAAAILAENLATTVQSVVVAATAPPSPFLQICNNGKNTANIIR